MKHLVIILLTNVCMCTLRVNVYGYPQYAQVLEPNYVVPDSSQDTFDEEIPLPFDQGYNVYPAIPDDDPNQEECLDQDGDFVDVPDQVIEEYPVSNINQRQYQNQGAGSGQQYQSQYMNGANSGQYQSQYNNPGQYENQVPQPGQLLSQPLANMGGYQYPGYVPVELGNLVANAGQQYLNQGIMPPPLNQQSSPVYSP